MYHSEGSMKRAIVNFSKEYDYESFKNYADENKISLSKALLDLAQKSLESWEDEKVASVAANRLRDPQAKYLSADEFLEKTDV